MTLTTPLAPGVLAMMLADARLPSGGHAHSAGLEPALAGGLAAHDVWAYLRGRARTTVLVDAATAVVTRHLALESDFGGFRAAERAWAARTPSRAQREAARLLGRGYFRIAARFWPNSLAVREIELLGRASRPLVLGVMAAEGGMTPLELARVAVYDEIASAAAALLKLHPTDPVEVAGCIVTLCSEVDPLVQRIAECITPADIPASGGPQSEGWAEAHSLSNRRLFRA